MADTTAESLAQLRPAFGKDGTITAGSASQISDGAAAVVVMSKAKAEELGLTWLAEIGAHGVVAGPDASLHEQPAHAIQAALAKEGIAAGDLDLVEINEAFAAVGLVSQRELGLHRRPGQRQRRRDRPRAPGRHVRGPDRPPPRARAAAPRRGTRGRCPLRWRRPGRRPDRARTQQPDRPADLQGDGRRGAGRACAARPSACGGTPDLPGRGRCPTTSARRWRCWPPLLRARAGRRPDRRAGRRQVDADRRRWCGAARADGDRVGGAGRRPVVAVLRRGAAGRPGTHAGARDRPRRLHPLDGDARAPRRPRAGRPRRRSACSTPPASTSCWSRPSGVGQSEVEVAGAADTVVVLVAPGMGDGVQAAKAGHPRDRRRLRRQQGRPGRRRQHRARAAAHALASASERADQAGWTPPVLKTVASTGEGIPELVAALDEHRDWLVASGGLQARRRRRAAAEIEAITLGVLRGRIDAGQRARRPGRARSSPVSSTPTQRPTSC